MLQRGLHVLVLLSKVRSWEGSEHSGDTKGISRGFPFGLHGAVQNRVPDNLDPPCADGFAKGGIVVQKSEEGIDFRSDALSWKSVPKICTQRALNSLDKFAGFASRHQEETNPKFKKHPGLG